MGKIDFKKLIAAITAVCRKAPITYINETIIIFRGKKISIKGNKATSLYFDFTFESVRDFIENLRSYGLMLSQSEFYKIMEKYGTKDSK